MMARRITPRNEKAFLDAVNADPEFRLASRYWNGSFRLTMGPDEAILFRVREGVIADVHHEPTPFDAFDFEIDGPAEGWTEILAETPRPFYQDVASAVMRHGFALRGDVESFFAYHAALRRVIACMRSMPPAGT